MRRVHRAAVGIVIVLLGAARASAHHRSVVIDDHGGRKGATFNAVIVPSYGQLGSPLVQAKACVNSPARGIHGHLAGTEFGHPDPILKDPAAVCGHGVAILLNHQLLPGRPPPEAGLDVTRPVPPGEDEGSATRSLRQRLSRAALLDVLLGLLRQIDQQSGDRVSAVADVRSVVHSHDIRAAAKNLPMPMRSRQDRE